MKIHKSIKIGAIMLSLAILLAGCSQSANKGAFSPAVSQSVAENSKSFDMSVPQSGGGEMDIAANEESGVDVSQKKIIKTSWFDLQTKEFSKTLELINNKISELSGYVEYSNTNGSESEKNAQTNFTVRIPQNGYESFNDFLKGEDFHVTSSGESATDITDQYVDVDARLSSLEAREKRMLELLNQAQTVEDMVAIEEKLGDLRTQIEVLTAQLKNFDQQVDFSSVTINLVQTDSMSLKKSDGFWAQAWEKIQMAFSLLINSTGYLLIAVVVALPYLLVAYLIYRIIKKRKAKKATPDQNEPIAENSEKEEPQANEK